MHQLEDLADTLNENLSSGKILHIIFHYMPINTQSS